MTPAYTEARKACFTVLDFETTGSVPGYAVEPWQVGLVRVRGGRVCPDEAYESLLRIGDRPFNPRAPGRHAMLREVLRDAPALAEVWPDLSGWISGVPLVAHHVGTERSVLRRFAPLHQLGPWVDTLVLVRWAYPSLRSKALADVVDALRLSGRVRELCPDRDAHDALFDAFACAAVLEHLLGLPGWEQITVQALAGR